MANIPIIIEKEGRPLTTSRAIAEQFGKQHNHVLRDIERLTGGLSKSGQSSKQSEDQNSNTLTEEQYLKRKLFFEENFQLTTYTNSQGKEQPMYLITKAGFSILAMGFTGDRAIDFKIDYINAFDRMENMLKTGVSSIALQNIEKRLEAIETTAGKGENAARDAVVNSFLQALKTAFDSGGYYLDKKHAKKPTEQQQGVYLGYYDEFIITMKSTEAYTIYERSTEQPLNYKTLWDILAMAGLIKARTTRQDRRRKFHGKDFSAIQIYIDKAKMIEVL
jgi:Rha family phage regulatory protein